MNQAVGSVAELQGLYGSYSFSEYLLQKIWLRGDFDGSRALTAEGERIEIIHPGRWNKLGGPDFLGARIRFGANPEVTGDVELHLREEDWAAHKHEVDPAYDRVVLHVVLFPRSEGSAAEAKNMRPIPVLALLALLQHDLEEFAADEAIERMAARPSGLIFETLSMMSPAALDACLRSAAGLRWRQKVHYARLRIERLGWAEACHTSALEILGYRFNRAAMLRVAGKFPLETWTQKDVSADEVLASEHGHWQVQGVRPANHPRSRLDQYRRWVQASADWPQRLAELAGSWPQVSAEQGTRALRAEHGFGALRARLAETCCGSALSGTRLDTFVIDGALPLVAARFRNEAEIFGSWFHWFPGDLPPMVSQTLKDLSVSGVAVGQPAINGFAQGVLGWWWQRDANSRGPSS